MHEIVNRYIRKRMAVIGDTVDLTSYEWWEIEDGVIETFSLEKFTLNKWIVNAIGEPYCVIFPNRTRQWYINDTPRNE